MKLNIENIKTLAQIMSKENLNSIELAEGDLQIKMERTLLTSFEKQDEIPRQSAEIEEVTLSSSTLKTPHEEVIIPEKNINLTEIKSPMVGVFYESSKPGSPAFVEVGSAFKHGDTLCIIEAMKLMNEIIAEKSGKIIEKCVENGQVVEFGQVIYRIQEEA